MAENHPLIHIKGMIGQHSIQITMDIYGYLMPNRNKPLLNPLDDKAIHNSSATLKKEKPRNPKGLQGFGVSGGDAGNPQEDVSN